MFSLERYKVYCNLGLSNLSHNGCDYTSGKVAMYMGFYLWILYPVTLPYFSMCTPIPYSLNYCCFTISTSFSVSPETVFLFQRFGYSRSFAFQYEFLNKSVISIKKKLSEILISIMLNYVSIWGELAFDNCVF